MCRIAKQCEKNKQPLGRATIGHMLYHAVGWLAGWLEGGLIARPKIFLMECEILQ